MHWRPWLTCNLGLLTLVLALGAMPCRTFHATSRFSLLRALFDSVVAPCAPVTFWHVIVADYMTSLAKTFSDLQLTACISYAIVQVRLGWRRRRRLRAGLKLRLRLWLRVGLG